MANKDYISDELLASFLEGEVNKEEMMDVLQTMENDAELQEVIDVAMRVEGHVLPMFQMAAESGRNLCDIKCEAYILQQRNISYIVEELLDVAKKKKWIRREGTPLYCIGKLLEYKGLIVERTYDATLNDIEEAIKKDEDIIVAVDSDKLYPERPDDEDLPNHAVVVTDIDTEKVSIYDPGSDQVIAIDSSLFLSAWAESHCYVVKVIEKQ